MSLLVVHNLKKQFAKTATPAVNGISFDLAPGEILGLLGPNGAGKTTTISMLLSTLTPTSGQISYFGKDFFKHRSEILQQVGFASTYVKLPGRLTVYENLAIYGRLYALNARERQFRIKMLLEQFNAWHLRDQEVVALSAGQMTKIMLVKAFLARPKLVLLDEPTASLDPDVAYDVRQFVMQQRKQEGTAFLFTSHNMDEVAQVCDRIIVLKKGTIIANNTPQELAKTVSEARVELVIDAGLQEALGYATEQSIVHAVQDKTVTFTVDEQKIAQFLMALAQRHVHYIDIVVHRPSLEDYFLRVAQEK